MEADTIQAFSSRANWECLYQHEHWKKSCLNSQGCRPGHCAPTWDVVMLSTTNVIQFSYFSNLRNFTPEASLTLLSEHDGMGINLFLSFPFPFLVMHSFLLSFSRQLTISHHGYLGWSLIRKFTYLTRISSILASFCITTRNMSSVSFKKISLFWYTDQFPFLMKETE